MEETQPASRLASSAMSSVFDRDMGLYSTSVFNGTRTGRNANRPGG
jgi:hypothetical protein